MSRSSIFPTLLKTLFAAGLCILVGCRPAGQSLLPDWTTAGWIGLETPDSLYCDKDGHSCLPARYLTKEIQLSGKPRQAVLYMAAGGFADYFINGKPVSGEVLGPLPSDYKRTVYVRSYDVTPLLRQGGNSLLIRLAPGWFKPLLADYGMPDYGTPRVMAQLVVRDSRSLDRFSTDTTWQVSDRGPVRSSNLYDGECYDARYEDSLQWLPAMLLEAPEGILRMQEAPGQTIADSLTAKRIWRNGQTSFIVDMGENMVGWLAVRGKGQTGVPVVIRMAERLAADSQTLYTDNLREARATNCYIPRDSMPFRYCPSTVWQGFRYAEITGLTDMPELTDLTGYIVGDAMRCTGGFHCSDSLLNRLFLAAKRGIRGNYHGFPTDCPQRDERLGWLGDRMTGCYGESFIYDNKALYLKWMQDIEDTQTPAGQLSDIAPAYWGIRKHDNVTWTGTYIAVADMLLERYGCEEGVRRHYDSMRRWVEYTVKQGMRDSIMTIDTYGDWCMPPERPELIHSKDPSRRTEAAVLSTTVMYGLLQKMQRFALLMGRDSDRIAFERLAEGMKRAYNRQFLNPVTGGYSNRTVTANVLSFALGLVPEEERQRVMQQIVQTTETDFNSHVSCGVLGIQHLMRTLSRNGRPDLALRIARQTDFPSWGYMLEHGATTIWELWNGDTAAPEMNSGNHVMLLGDLLLWFYEDLAGIRPDQNGFRHLHMQPCFPDGLDCVDARYESAAGIITSGWQRLPDGSIRWQIGLPEHTGATVVLPDLTTREIKGRQELVFRP